MGKAAAINDKARPARELFWPNVAAVLLILAASFLVIQSTHSCRALYAQLQELEADQWRLQEDYGRLLLEHSTWASHHRVEKVAVDDLKMQAPDLAHHKVIPR